MSTEPKHWQTNHFVLFIHKYTKKMQINYLHWRIFYQNVDGKHKMDHRNRQAIVTFSAIASGPQRVLAIDVWRHLGILYNQVRCIETFCFPIMFTIIYTYTIHYNSSHLVIRHLRHAAATIHNKWKCQKQKQQRSWFILKQFNKVIKYKILDEMY